MSAPNKKQAETVSERDVSSERDSSDSYNTQDMDKQDIQKAYGDTEQSAQQARSAEEFQGVQYGPSFAPVSKDFDSAQSQMNLRLKPLENPSSEEGKKPNDPLTLSAEVNLGNLVHVAAISPSSKNEGSEKQPAGINKIQQKIKLGM